MAALSTVTISPKGPTMTYFPVTTPEPWPPVILYGARPLSLDAAQIERDLAPDEQDQNGNRVRLDCPTGNSSTTTRTPEGVGRCAASRMYVPVRLTAGAVEPGGWGTGGSYWFDPTNANNEFISALSSEKCPDPTSLVGFEAARTTPAPSGTGTGTGTGTAAGTGRVSRGESAGPLALFCAVLACASVVELLSVPL